MRARSSRFPRTQLTLQTLEDREVPAGLINASLSPTGVLTITGDDAGNGVMLKLTATDVTLDPDATTSVNGQGNDVNVVLAGTVTSIKADLKGGNDDVSIDPLSSFQMTGAASFTLGDGNNNLNLTTNLFITLASLTVKGGDGIDTVVVQGGAGQGSRIAGPSSFSYANGGSDTTLGDVEFGSTVKLTAGDAISTPNNLTATTVTVAKTFKADLGNSFPALASFFDSNLGGLSVRGQSTGAVLTSTSVSGNVTVKGGFDTALTVDTSTVTGNVKLTAPRTSFDASGDGSTIGGTLTMLASAYSQTSFQTATLSQVSGNITVTGGWYSDSFTANGFFRAAKNLSLNLGGGDNQIALGDQTSSVNVTGTLTIKTGAGADTISLTRAAVTGAVSILTNAGIDQLSIEDSSSFAATFTAELGSGDDTISIAQNPSADLGDVSFTGLAKIKAGLGNDTLLLGLAAGSGGDADSRARFFAAGNIVDGGDGLDTFNVAASQFIGVTPAGWNP
jgi:hypothetical protein